MTNRFKGLDMIECLKDCGWRFVTLYRRHDQDHPQEKEMQNGKMVVWGGFTNSYEKREAKGKGEKETYILLNAEFQRVARRDKKAFLSDQCKEIEEKNRMGKTRNLFRKIRDTKGTFYAKMGIIKGWLLGEVIIQLDLKRRGEIVSQKEKRRQKTGR